ncbi:MAG: AraC family transcriptional regulator, partial [Pseudomonadota bacterium]
MPHKLAILNHPTTALFELGCATELFLLPRDNFEDWYETEIVAYKSHSVESLGGLRLNVKMVDDFTAYDSVVVPSWPVKDKAVDPGLRQALTQHHK